MSLLPLFPLPNVVLFPGVLLPLHIFEPRYRAMVADALDDDRRLGMVLLQPGWEGDYEGRPAIYPIGCSGVIVHASKLPDGRFNIALQGLERVRVIEEDRERSYRRAVVETLSDPPIELRDRETIRDLRGRLETLIGVRAESDADPADAKGRSLTLLPDAEFVHALAHALDLDPLEKQALLERQTLQQRAQGLVELLEMRRMLGNRRPASQRPH